MKAKKKHKISIRPYVGLSLSAIALSPVATSAYEWPVRPRMAQHVVTATLAEYRSADGNDPAHFHSGVDIGEAGAAVYPVEGDTAFVRGQGVNIGHFRYFTSRAFQTAYMGASWIRIPSSAPALTICTSGRAA